jgi:queuine tRNA-ribosyltransferase
LFIAKEVLALELATIHNLTFYVNLTDTAREKIIEGNFSEWKNKIISKLSNKINN